MNKIIDTIITIILLALFSWAGWWLYQSRRASLSGRQAGTLAPVIESAPIANQAAVLDTESATTTESATELILTSPPQNNPPAPAVIEPVFTHLPIISTPGPDVPLYRFSVGSASAGNVEVKQLSFVVNTVGVNVTSLYLYDPRTRTQLTDNPVSPDSNGIVKLVVGTAVDHDLLLVSPTARTYEVRGTITGWGDAGDAITVRFQQDTADAETVTAGAALTRFYNVWSNRSAAQHSLETADWFNGYGLRGMNGVQEFGL